MKSRLYRKSNDLLIEPIELSSCKNSNDYFLLALSASMGKDYLTAISLYIKSLTQSPKHYESLLNIGSCYIRIHSFQDSKQKFEQCILINKKRYEAYFNKALAHFYLEEYDQAILCLKESPLSNQRVSNLSSLCIERSSKQHRYSNIFEKPMIFRLTRGIEDFDTRKLRTSSIDIPDLPSPSKSIRRTDSTRNYNYRSRASSQPRSKDPIYPGRKSNLKGSSVTESIHISTKMIQQELSNAQKKKNILKNKDVFQSCEKKLGSLRKKVAEKYSEIPQEEPVKTSNLTLTELHTVLTEMEVPGDTRNYEILGKVLEKLLFFNKFPAKIIIPLLQSATVKKLLLGETIYSQGSVCDSVYVILKGSVSIIRASEDSGNKPIIVGSIYDGQQCGEMSLDNLEEPCTCSATISEDTYILLVSKEVYKEILMKELYQDLQEKVKFLNSLAIFEGVQPNLLVPLASNIEIKRFAINDAILSKGEVPVGLHILFKGHAIVCTEGYSVKNVYNKSPKRAFYTGKEEPVIKHKRKVSLHNPIERVRRRDLLQASPRDKQLMRKTLSTEEIKGLETDPDHCLVKENIKFATLIESDFFAGRSLIYEKTTPAKFTIVAQAPQTDVIVISYQCVSFLNQNVQDQMINVLKKSYEVDCPDDINPRLMDHYLKYWQKLRKDIYH